MEFDETRAELLRVDNRLPAESMMVVPNAPPGEAKLEKGRYWRDKFERGKGQKIVLYTGGVADYNLTYEIIRSTETWPADAVLVMHCWSSKEEVERLKDFARHFKREIYFSTEMLPFDEIDKIYASADIGFAMYGDQDLNHKYAGLSSGKLFNFMRASVPIITNDTPSCRRAVEETGCGVCIGDVSEIGGAIQRILEGETEYRENCCQSFKFFEFEYNYKRVIAAIEDHLRMCF